MGRENSKRKTTPSEMVEKLAKYLGVTEEYFSRRFTKQKREWIYSRLKLLNQREENRKR
jgi:hypothetical protein